MLRKNKQIQSRLAVVSICLLTILAFPQPAGALWHQGYCGISKYQSEFSAPNSCLEDRAGAQYVANLHDMLYLRGVGDSGTMHLDNYVWQKDFWDTGFVDTSTWFAWSGHSFAANDPRAVSSEGTLHFTNENSATLLHPAGVDNDPPANVIWDQVRLGAKSARWATFYSCNWLANLGSTNNESRITNMFQGLRLMMGFASLMYLDSREGISYGQDIANGWTIKDSFFDAAQYYQTQLTPAGYVVVARVKGWNSALADDKTVDNPAAAPIWVNSPFDFFTWDHQITTDGKSK